MPDSSRVSADTQRSCRFGDILARGMLMSPNTRGCLAAMALALVACGHAWDSFDPRLGADDAGVDGTTASASSATAGGAQGGGATTSTGAGASGGASGSSSGGGGASVECPTGAIAMVLVGGYCIDSTEVTQDAYAAWLAGAPDPASQPAECAWNLSFVPIADWPPAAGQGDLPVHYVDWCDARAYCAGVGKRLCGRIGGGANLFGDVNDTTKDEWYAACTQGGTTVYPYGAVYQPQTCNGCEYGDPTCGTGAIDALLPVGAAAGCHGTMPPYDAIFDLSGNVWEWEDSCEASMGAKDPCHVRGASFISQLVSLACNGLSQPPLGRDGSDELGADETFKTGVRCCGP